MATPGPEHDSLAALAAQLGDLRGKVVYIQSRLDRAGLTGDLNLPAKVEDLAQAVAALTAAVPEPRHTAPFWLALAPTCTPPGSPSWTGGSVRSWP